MTEFPMADTGLDEQCPVHLWFRLYQALGIIIGVEDFYQINLIRSSVSGLAEPSLVKFHRGNGLGLQSEIGKDSYLSAEECP